MNIHKWNVFDKSGNLLNWKTLPYISVNFESPTGINADGFLNTDIAGKVASLEILNGGYMYDDVNQITLSYVDPFSDITHILTPQEASIYTKDVSIFNPEGKNTKSIESVSVNIDASFMYPSVTHTAAIFLKPISVGLIENEQLYILEENMYGELMRPYIPTHESLLSLIFRLEGDENEIQFFNINENENTISWSDDLVVDVNVYEINTPIQLNIGFKAEKEGVYERILRIYLFNETENSVSFLGEIVVNAEAVGEDERFRTLLTNFGLPDPVDMKEIFKESDINEDLPDWELLNYKSKHMILEHDKIIPYIGTYKGLINSLKWLGYDDIFIREWFLNVKENKKISFMVPYDAKDRTQTILMFNEDERRVFRKLNQLSLNYCLTRETGDVDMWGVPITKNCYNYNIKEIFVKLLGLKKWLEKNIIGVNCRIIDITGEGVYFERIQSSIYGIHTIGHNINLTQNMSPYGIDEISELFQGDASVRLSIKELNNVTLGDMQYKLSDFVHYAWHHETPNVFYTINDPFYLSKPDEFLLVGPPLSFPLMHVKDIMYRLSTKNNKSGTLIETLVTNPLFVINNEIRFYNNFDTSSLFYDISTNLNFYIERGYLRDPSIDEWANSIAYSIYYDSSVGNFILESSTGIKRKFNTYPTFKPDTGSMLQYAIDDNYKVPLLSMNNYRTIDKNGINIIFNKKYFLDIIDGAIEMNAGVLNPQNSSDNINTYLQFNYDNSLNEQSIYINNKYTSQRMRLYEIDPSVYFWADPSGKTGGNNPNSLVIDNSIYTMHINNIGQYNIEMFGWDDYNTMFYNISNKKYPVWIKYPTIYTLIDNSCNNSTCVSTFIDINKVNDIVSQNKFPIYDRNIVLQGLSIHHEDINNPNSRLYIKVPSITYFQDIPRENSISKFYNLTERVTHITNNLNTITIDPDYQKFYIGDNVNLLKIDKGSYSLISEVSSHIIGKSGFDLTLDYLSPNITLDSSSYVFILNDTHRSLSDIRNTSTGFSAIVDGYVFEPTQLVGVIVTDNDTGYSWGASYNVLSVNGSRHTFDGGLPNTFFIDPTMDGSINHELQNNPNKYNIEAKHAYSTYANLVMLTDKSSEVNNAFHIYTKDSKCQEYYLDNTFVYINILFDQDRVNEQWYNASDNLINGSFYFHSNPIIIDSSTLVILKSIYDPSMYLLNQKNIWEISKSDTNELIFKVYNDSIPFIFNDIGSYNIRCTSYDKFGNSITKKYEGLVKVI